jgi:lipoprotein-anchoring transpeptidase ErfK/SrfK
VPPVEDLCSEKGHRVRTKTFIAAAATLGIVVLLTCAVAAYDHAGADEIAPGVAVGGVQLGGMSRAEAKARLEREVLAPLERPIVVHHGTKTWKLTARQAGIRADVDAMVDEAIARSRSGDVFSRSWRSLTGRRLRADLAPRVRYSRAAVAGLVDRIGRALRRAPSDARVELSGDGVEAQPERIGLALRARTLQRRIVAAITSPTASRTFVATTHHTKPKVTTAQLAKQYDTVVIVNRDRFTLKLYKHLKLHETFGIAVGMVGLETPAGEYKIANKAINPAWHVPNSAWAGSLAGQVIPGGDASNPIKSRWLGIYDGVGIHGTSDDASIGHDASHGCIRMHIPDVERLYDEVPVGTPVYIA